MRLSGYFSIVTASLMLAACSIPFHGLGRSVTIVQPSGDYRCVFNALRSTPGVVWVGYDKDPRAGLSQSRSDLEASQVLERYSFNSEKGYDGRVDIKQNPISGKGAEFRVEVTGKHNMGSEGVMWNEEDKQLHLLLRAVLASLKQECRIANFEQNVTENCKQDMCFVGLGPW